MTDFREVYKTIQDKLESMPISSKLVIKTDLFGVAKTIGQMDYGSSPDKEEIERIFLTAKERSITIGCILYERGFGFSRYGLAELKMNGVGEKMVKSGAEVIFV